MIILSETLVTYVYEVIQWTVMNQSVSGNVKSLLKRAS